MFTARKFVNKNHRKLKIKRKKYKIMKMNNFNKNLKNKNQKNQMKRMIKIMKIKNPIFPELKLLNLIFQLALQIMITQPKFKILQIYPFWIFNHNH